MQQTPPPRLPWHIPDLPARPAVPQAPRPDVIAVRRLAVPHAAPPYDDEPPDPDGPTGEGMLDARGLSQAEPPCPPGPLSQAEPPCPPEAPCPPERPRPAEATPAAPDTAGWPSQFAQVLAETLAGARPPQQLTPWTTEQARQRIRQLGPILVTDQRPRVRRIVTSAPSQDVLELSAVVGFGPRVRALAVRLERGEARPYRPNSERWRCTEIETA